MLSNWLHNYRIDYAIIVKVRKARAHNIYFAVILRACHSQVIIWRRNYDYGYKVSSILI